MPPAKKKARLKIVRAKGTKVRRRKPRSPLLVSVTVMPPEAGDGPLTFHVVVDTESMQPITLSRAVTFDVDMDDIKSYDS